ncbi:MAG: DUF3137 domain-containing protein [Hyphomonas sp.]|uniref:DUF3137 domain-containing protein n=1 Tax=Hyphomonas sp. TaxID=87 RepID=UPI0017A32E03|nr:DUF3137 domain-containing protein [Hyphomonas sp.]MBU3922222.1 DUF3137 domain-containing protein [Alphaproteobacteria bacterium]MBA3069035.1 DUF3137 domain-containing protein [Hyphomonas sp.]MBU4061668.1 DUF3137 domain-containing protein [Alphaproteobacteria bacterium]MBU4163513.1 DUF3137 domain-containing protein [Alphaproteobacteria bacterium]MBU4567663.1 DUF3137 domain-containing protein [Alphaproteobacteria bacterium]
MSWDRDLIEQQPGFAGARARADREIRAILEKSPKDAVNPGREKQALTRYFFGGFASFVIMFLIVQALLPKTGWGELISFLLFPLLFFLNIALALFLLRGRLTRLFIEAQARLAVKAEALTTIIRPLGLTYVPAPGGAPKGLEWLAKQSWAPPEFRKAAEALQHIGGMDKAVETVRDCGLFTGANVYVVGSPEQKAKYAEYAAANRRIEDGFEGRLAGLAMSMFEWIESVEDAPDVPHLVIVLEAPFQLHGVTQLRARKTSWPQDPAGRPLQEVDLGPKAFDALYRLRASDQVEARAIFNPAVIERVIALAHGGKFRAVAQGNYLVFDFAGGPNRFQLVDLLTGVWSDETIRQTHADLAETLALVETLGHAFMLARKSDTGGA